MEKGYLVFELRKDNGAEPIVDAQVKIINIDGREVNRLLKVNDDGKTDEIEVYTKDSKLTFNQLNKEIPYTRIDAEVKLGNDKIMEIEGIQVYSNTTSIQEIKFDNRVIPMRHHKDKKGKGKKEHIHIKNENPCVFSHGSDSKDKGDILKEDKSLKPIVKIEELYIPQFITVHLGEPGDEGEIITVPFVDYVKNVACSTVYPTWNEEAIKANIHAIVSFALNRVYTDWYRSKGYGFEITSSKTHDQMYVKGRTLFRNVCEIVDDVFDKCIKVEGYYQPLLSRCENTTSDYKVLSRWGSLSLAEDGLFALDILKKYFGDNVQIVDVSKIECVMKKCPHTELSHGSNGEDVRFLQKALNKISSHYKGVLKISAITGHFGEETEKAVRDFQRIFNLKEDGIVGHKTWKKICMMYAIIKRLDHNESLEEMAPEFKTLFYGQTGEDIKRLQEDLNKILKDFNNYDEIKEDGIFGPDTEKAVKFFQRVFGLNVDGVAGKNTLGRIEYAKEFLKDLKDLVEYHNQINSVDSNKNDKEVKALEDSQLIVEPRKTEELIEIRKNLPISKGDQGDDVSLIQLSLNRFSNYYNLNCDLQVNGRYDTSVENMVREFQRKFGLGITGIMDVESFDNLMRVNRLIGELNIINNDIYRHHHHHDEKHYIDIPLKRGDRGDSVYRLQRDLNNLSRYYGFLGKVKEDGIFGPETEDMVKRFQKHLFLRVDGIFGKECLAKLKTIMDAISHLEDLDPQECKLCTQYKDHKNDHHHNKDHYHKPNMSIEIVYPKNYLKRITKYLNDVNINLPLTKGSEGEDVKLIQTELNKLITAYGGRPLDVNGKYDDRTEEAINKFKQKLGFPITGSFDENDFNMLMDINNNIKDLGYLSVKICKEGNCKIHIYYPKNNGMTNYEVIYPNVNSEFQVPATPNISSYPMNADNQFVVSTLQHNPNDNNNNGGFIELDTGVAPNFEGSAYYENPNPTTPPNTDPRISDSKVNNFVVDSYRLEEENLNTHNFKGEYSMLYPEFDLEYGCISGYVTLAQKYINTIKEKSRGYFRNNVLLVEDGVFGDNTLLYVKEIQDKFRCSNGSKIDRTVWNRLVLEYEKICSK